MFQGLSFTFRFIKTKRASTEWCEQSQQPAARIAPQQPPVVWLYSTKAADIINIGVPIHQGNQSSGWVFEEVVPEFLVLSSLLVTLVSRWKATLSREHFSDETRLNLRYSRDRADYRTNVANKCQCWVFNVKDIFVVIHERNVSEFFRKEGEFCSVPCALDNYVNNFFSTVIKGDSVSFNSLDGSLRNATLVIHFIQHVPIFVDEEAKEFSIIFPLSNTMALIGKKRTVCSPFADPCQTYERDEKWEVLKYTSNTWCINGWGKDQHRKSADKIMSNRKWSVISCVLKPP